MLYLLQFVTAVELSDFLVGVRYQETERIALGYLAKRLAVSSDGIRNGCPVVLFLCYELQRLSLVTQQLYGFLMVLHPGVGSNQFVALASFLILLLNGQESITGLGRLMFQVLLMCLFCALVKGGS